MEKNKETTEKMSQKNEISFSYNWNKKLDNNSFTTIRLSNESKYQVNKHYNITLCGNFLKKVIIVAIKRITINQINEYIAQLDTGYSQVECQNVLYRMYPFLRKDPSRELFFILMRTINEK